ncbi:MAG: thiamine-phosphate kinase [Gemmatimonadota bacterium]
MSESRLHPDEDVLTRAFAAIAPLPPEGVLLLGIGDDAAVLRPLPGEDLVWTVDSLEEGIDFERAWLDLEEAGGRAVGAALSDLAAMGARPLALLLALGSASEEAGRELLTLFRGAASAGERFGAAVAGGDLTHRERGAAVTVTALGAVPAGAAIRRSGARAGDELWVTGTLGAAAAGLRLLRSHGRARAAAEDPGAVERFVRPVPRLREGAWLLERSAVRAALDLSDGLARDLARLCAASRVGARLDEDALRRVAHRRDADGLRDALHGGEDFELLLAVAPGVAAGVAEDFRARFDLPLTRVGHFVSGSGVTVRGPSGEGPLPPEGFDPLARPSARRGPATACRTDSQPAERSSAS